MGHGFTGQSRVMVYKQLLRSNKLGLELHSMRESLVSLHCVGCRCRGADVVLLTRQDYEKVGNRKLYLKLLFL